MFPHDRLTPSLPVFTDIWNATQTMTTPRVHIDILTWFNRELMADQPRLLLMAFRSCGKSTLVGLLCAWLLLRDPNLRILIISAEEQLAVNMVRNVRKILEHHPLLEHLKPKKLEQWSSKTITVERSKVQREPSLTAAGIRGNITGARADIIICDDVEVPNTCDGYEKRAFLRERLQELDFILTPKGGIIYIGTPHHYETIYAENAHKELGETEIFLKGYKRLVVPILDQENKSAWPERFPENKIERMRQRVGPARFAAQMMLEPTSLTNMRLDPKAIQFYPDELSYQEAGRRAVLKIGETKLVSASCWWDPAFGDVRGRGDGSVLAIVYCDEEGHYYLHDIVYIKIDTHNALENNDNDIATLQCERVAERLEHYYISSITIETNGIGQFLPAIMRKVLKQRGQRVAVREQHSVSNKNERILSAFDVVLASAYLHAHQRVRDTPFIREMQDWRPNKSSQRDDGLDAVASAILSEPIRIGTNTPYISHSVSQRSSWRGVGKIYEIREEMENA